METTLIFHLNTDLLNMINKFYNIFHIYFILLSYVAIRMLEMIIYLIMQSIYYDIFCWTIIEIIPMLSSLEAVWVYLEKWEPSQHQRAYLGNSQLMVR